MTAAEIGDGSSKGNGKKFQEAVVKTTAMKAATTMAEAALTMVEGDLTMMAATAVATSDSSSDRSTNGGSKG